MKKFAFFLLLLISTQPGIAQWKSCSTTLFGGLVSALYSNDDRIFAGTKAGAFVSTDYGLTWSITSLNRETVNVFAKIGNNLYAGTTDGLYRSANNGDAWSQIAVGPYDNVINSIAVAGNNFFVGSTEGVYLSTDGAASWSPKNTGIGAMPFITSVIAHGSKIFAGTKDKGLFVSTNNGENWSSVGSINFRINSLAEMGSDIYAATSNGVFVSTDDGATWNRKSNGLNEIYIYTLAAYNNYVFLGAGDGVYVSTNNGENWLHTNLDMEAVTTLAFVGADLFAGRNEVVDHSEDYGVTWQIGSASPTNNFPYSFIQSGNDIYLASYRGVFKSTDNCGSWTAKTNGLMDTLVKGLAVNGNRLVAFTPTDSIFYSTDGGENWAVVRKLFPAINPPPFITSMAVDENRIYAATINGFYYTSNKGNEWYKRGVGFDVEEVTAMALNGPDIYIGLRNQGLYRSSNLGLNWTKLTNGLTSVGINGITIKDGRIGLATNDGIFLSTDNGANWQISATGLSNPLQSVVAMDGNTLISGSDLGIYISKNGGASWFEANNGLVYHIIKGIAIKGDDVYVGTFGGGIFKAKISEFEDTQVEDSIPPAQDVFLYPNPADDYLKIILNTRDELTDESIRIYDLLGHELISEKADNPKSISVDVRILPPGIYLIRIGEERQAFVKN